MNPDCKYYQQIGHTNLRVRKIYGQDQLRYLKCSACQTEFSERKGTALWNTKVSEAQAESVAAHLAEGCSQAATVRLTRVDPSVVRRMNRVLGQHAQNLHDQRVQNIVVRALEADERHGYAETKQNGCWEVEVIDPESKFVVAHGQGKRTGQLIETVLQDAAKRLHNRHDLLLMTDGEATYATVFPTIFGEAYQPKRNGERGRLPHIAYRIPRTLAHVQVVKHRQNGRVVSIETRYTHGTPKYAQKCLFELGCKAFNTSAIERRNGTARRMSAYQVRRSSAFAHTTESKLALGWWGVTVYNWCRTHKSLKQSLSQPEGRRTSTPRTPAMALGLSTHVWSLRDLLLAQVFIPPRR